MNFDAAMAAHAAWYTKLSRYLAKPDGSLSAFLAESANHCELGMWLDNDGKAYTRMPEFGVLVASHEEFHRIAGELIRKANAGQSVPDEIALGPTSEIALASAKLVRSMITMETKSGQRGIRICAQREDGTGLGCSCALRPLSLASAVPLQRKLTSTYLRLKASD